MKKSHYIFIGFCVVWIIVSGMLVSTSPHSKELWDKQDLATNIGQLIGNLIYPSIGYGIYLFIKWWTSKSKQKTTAI